MLPSVATARQVDLPPDLGSALTDKLGLSSEQVPRWSDGVVAVGTNWSAFGWGGDASVPATISEDEAPWSVPVAIGMNYVQWQDPALLPDFGDFSVSNGMLTGAVNGGPQLNRTYAVMTAVMGDDIPVGSGMEFLEQFDFVLGIPGLDVWGALPQYPDDTWNGGAFVASLASGSGGSSPTSGGAGWGLNFYTFGQGEISTNPLGGFAIVNGNTLLFGVEADPSIFGNGSGGFNPLISGRLALDIKNAPANPSRSRVVTAPAVPLDEHTFFSYLGSPRPIVPGFPGLFDIDEVVPFVGPEGNLWFKLYPFDPWGPTPPDGFFSDYVQVAFRPAGSTEDPRYVGFQTHDGVDEAFSGQGATSGPLAAGFVMDDGAILLGTGVPYDGGALDVFAQGGFLLEETSVFQYSQYPSLFDPEDVEQSDDPQHFDDEYPVYDLTTGEPVEAPATTTLPTSTTTIGSTETTAPGSTATTAPASTATTTTLPATVENPRYRTTPKEGTCWWCWGVLLLFVLFLLCILFTRLKTYEWWSCWVPWFVVIWVWVPFGLAGLWWWGPGWWWWPLLAWFPVVAGYAWWWGRRRSWWVPWMWFVVGGYLAALVVGMVLVGSPTWGLLFGLFWLPPVAFYLWYRPRRRPWWRPWLWGLFLAYVVWVFVWVIWLTPWWAWWFPVFLFPFLGWWFITHGYDWVLIRRKSCFLVPWLLLPWFGFMIVLSCLCC